MRAWRAGVAGPAHEAGAWKGRGGGAPGTRGWSCEPRAWKGGVTAAGLVPERADPEFGVGGQFRSPRLARGRAKVTKDPGRGRDPRGRPGGRWDRGRDVRRGRPGTAQVSGPAPRPSPRSPRAASSRRAAACAPRSAPSWAPAPSTCGCRSAPAGLGPGAEGEGGCERARGGGAGVGAAPPAGPTPPVSPALGGARRTPLPSPLTPSPFPRLSSSPSSVYSAQDPSLASPPLLSLCLLRSPPFPLPPRRTPHTAPAPNLPSL